MKKSKFLTLDFKDFLRGLLMAFLGSVITGLITAIDAGELPKTVQEWSPILLAGLASMLAYLSKNFFTNSADKVLKKEG